MKRHVKRNNGRFAHYGMSLDVVNNNALDNVDNQVLLDLSPDRFLELECGPKRKSKKITLPKVSILDKEPRK